MLDLDLNSITEFSRCHCIGICAVLVPLNLLLSTSTIFLLGTNRSRQLIYATVGIAIWPALALFLHVATWWSIGVVMLPTFILPVLATICLATHAYAIVNPRQMRALLLRIIAASIAKYHQLVTHRSHLIHH
jgi:prepilin signal peptidase PulO-like enzyme (type II secretory pathway)